MEPKNKKTIILPSGEKVGVNLPDSPQRDVRKFVIDKCKYHVPLKSLINKIDAGAWPTPELLAREIGTKLPDAELWTGSLCQWRTLMRRDESGKCTKRTEKLRAIRKGQQALRKITDDEWKALKSLFTIQRQLV